jgi:hypothetical protein
MAPIASHGLGRSPIGLGYLICRDIMLIVWRAIAKAISRSPAYDKPAERWELHPWTTRSISFCTGGKGQEGRAGGECRERPLRQPGLCPAYALVSVLAPRRGAVATPIEPPSFRWGAQPQEWTTYQETAVRPLYEAVFDQLGLSAGTRLLDVGCGAGLAVQLAASRGARVWALDASAALLEIARSRVPEGEFRLGDMAALPLR